MLKSQKIIHLALFVFFVAIVLTYFFPIINGKSLSQPDLTNLGGTTREILEYREKGEQVYWDSTIFSGMPAIGTAYTSFYRYIHQFMQNFINREIYIMMLMYLMIYVTCICLNMNPIIAFISGVACSFSLFNMIALEVGHVNKQFAMVFMAPVIGGVILVYRNKIVAGTLLILFALGSQILYNHIQISYYTLIGILFFQIVVMFDYIKNKKILSFLKKTIYLGFLALLVVIMHIDGLWATWNYQKSSNRAGTELTSDIDKNEQKKDGLDKEYATQWSNGISETFTMLIPYFHGGASQEALTKDSDTYKSLMQKGVAKQNAKEFIRNIPTYWGTQPFTAGPYYFGSIVIFLFVLGIFSKRNVIQIWSIVTALLALALSMGKNLDWLTDIFFYYVPFYNKFRTVTMITSLLEVTIVLGGCFALNDFLKAMETNQKLAFSQLIKALSVSAGICLLFYLIPGLFFDFRSPGDEKYRLPDWLVSAIISDRKSLFRNDALRSFFFIFLSGVMLMLILKNKINQSLALCAVALMVVIDLWGVNKRYLNDDDFKKARKTPVHNFQPSQLDAQILKDKDHFRVFNTTQSPTSDGITSRFHYSIGGYSAIKVQRYQDLIERYISKGDQDVINMLNARYFIIRDNQTQKLEVKKNINAYGNAWFVDSAKIVNGADEEIDALKTTNLESTAIIDARFSDKSIIDAGHDLNVNDDRASELIQLNSYHPDELKYTSKSGGDRIAVFSEVYYQPGWKSYIDGKETDHFRVNYILRGMVIPSGEHEIVFKFLPPAYHLGKTAAISANILGLLLFLFLLIKPRIAEENFSKYLG